MLRASGEVGKVQKDSKTSNHFLYYESRDGSEIDLPTWVRTEISDVDNLSAETYPHKALGIIACPLGEIATMWETTQTCQEGRSSTNAGKR